LQLEKENWKTEEDQLFKEQRREKADFFPSGQEVLQISERYIGNSDPYIILVSTPDKPGGLMETIKKTQNLCIPKIYLPYIVGVNTIYSKETLLKVSVSATGKKNIT
jgi:hypothetical protein